MQGNELYRAQSTLCVPYRDPAMVNLGTGVGLVRGKKRGLSMLKRFLALIATGTLIAGGVAVQHSSAATTTMNVMLAQVAFSGATGTAALTYDSTSGMTTVKITVKNLIPMSSHPAHIHSGTCSQNTPVIAPLTNVVAASNGVGTSTTMVKGTFANKMDHINVHIGPGVTLTEFTVISCGNL
jgi:hypothetical protein